MNNLGSYYTNIELPYASAGGWSRICGGEHFDEATLAKLGSILG